MARRQGGQVFKIPVNVKAAPPRLQRVAVHGQPALVVIDDGGVKLIAHVANVISQRHVKEAAAGHGVRRANVFSISPQRHGIHLQLVALDDMHHRACRSALHEERHVSAHGRTLLAEGIHEEGRLHIEPCLHEFDAGRIPLCLLPEGGNGCFIFMLVLLLLLVSMFLFLFLFMKLLVLVLVLFHDELVLSEEEEEDDDEVPSS